MKASFEYYGIDFQLAVLVKFVEIELFCVMWPFN
jgi:hypothetical protein